MSSIFQIFFKVSKLLDTNKYGKKRLKGSTMTEKDIQEIKCMLSPIKYIYEDYHDNLLEFIKSKIEQAEKGEKIEG